jgi:ferredoxin
MAYQVDVVKDVCISSGKCVADAPAVFRFDEEEIAEPTGGPHSLTDAQLVEIARTCPTGAITLRENGTEVPLD